MKGTRKDSEDAIRTREKNFARDFASAAGRVGQTPQARLRWLLRFAYQDIQGLSRGQLLDAGLELWAFLRYHQIDWQYNAADPSPEIMVRKFQARLQEGLARLDKAHPWTLRLQDAQFSICWTPARHLTLAKTFTGPPEDHFVIAVFDLLREFGQKVRSCPRPTCKRLFLPIRRQTYCSLLCNQSARTQRYRNRHADTLSDKRHEAYRRKVQATHPKARVTRRRKQK